MRVVIVQDEVSGESSLRAIIAKAWPGIRHDVVAMSLLLSGGYTEPLGPDDIVVMKVGSAADSLAAIQQLSAWYPQTIMVAVGAPAGGLSREAAVTAGASIFISDAQMSSALVFTLVSAAIAERDQPAAADSTVHRFLWQAASWPDEHGTAEATAARLLEQDANAPTPGDQEAGFGDDVLSFTAAWREQSRASTSQQYFWLTAPWRDTGGCKSGAGITPVEIPGYRIQRKIGDGGMSDVYLAVRERDELELVLKVLSSKLVNNRTQLQRFMREYKLISMISSSNVVRIYDQGCCGDQAYIAMEYFPQGDLRIRLGEPMDPRQAVRMLWGIARALHSIHARGIVHRDLKPANVMLRADGSVGLVDFGVSRRMGLRTGTEGLTMTGEVLGTPLYMSPEQGKAQRATPVSDLYSLGVIFYEMLTGEHLYTAKSFMMIIYMHAVEPVPRLPKSLASYQEVINRLLAKGPHMRFQSARELLKYIKTRWGEPKVNRQTGGDERRSA